MLSSAATDPNVEGYDEIVAHGPMLSHATLQPSKHLWLQRYRDSHPKTYTQDRLV